jgi:hypothetical protein
MCLSDASVFIPVLSLDAAFRAAEPRWLSTACARVRYEIRAHMSMVSLRSTNKHLSPSSLFVLNNHLSLNHGTWLSLVSCRCLYVD